MDAGAVVIMLLWIAVLASACVWIVLAFFRGGFWRAQPRLPEGHPGGRETVVAVIPARDEAESIASAVQSLLRQDYAGELRLIVVDDGSRDGTGEVALAAAAGDPRLRVISGSALPSGWSGKMWAVAQGVAESQRSFPEAPFILLTDADILHQKDGVGRLVAKLEADGLDLASLMVRLRCETFWERLLVPAFVFFFQKLYPFAWVGDPGRRTAAAAGGCILIRRTALEAAGGIAAIRDRIIDDVALAGAIKGNGGRIWLGLAQETHSLRAYDHLSEIWRMVARTAFVQLRHSAAMLAGAVAGMLVTYLAPPLAAFAGLAAADFRLAGAGIAVWAGMTALYIPTLRMYGRRAMFGGLLPLAALLYMAMTVDSALRHWRGAGNPWKGRPYDKPIGAD